MDREIQGGPSPWQNQSSKGKLSIIKNPYMGKNPGEENTNSNQSLWGVDVCVVMIYWISGSTYR